MELGPKQGGLTFASRGAQASGYQPFGSASAVTFWLKDKNGSSTIPNLSVRHLELSRLRAPRMTCFSTTCLGHTLNFPHSPAAASLLAALASSLSGSGINIAVAPYLISRCTSLCGFWNLTLTAGIQFSSIDCDWATPSSASGYQPIGRASGVTFSSRARMTVAPSQPCGALSLCREMLPHRLLQIAKCSSSSTLFPHVGRSVQGTHHFWVQPLPAAVSRPVTVRIDAMRSRPSLMQPLPDGPSADRAPCLCFEGPRNVLIVSCMGECRCRQETTTTSNTAARSRRAA